MDFITSEEFDSNLKHVSNSFSENNEKHEKWKRKCNFNPDGGMQNDWICNQCGFIGETNESLNIHKCNQNLDITSTQNSRTDKLKHHMNKEPCDTTHPHPFQQPSRIVPNTTQSQKSDLAAKKVKKDNKSSDSRFHCQHCGASFTQRNILELHVNGVHEKLKPFKCGHCQASFALKYTLEHHLKVSHDKLEPFKCSKCDFSTSKKDDLKIHESSQHQQITFNCDICGVKFPHRVDLDFHMSGAHQSKNFGCTICNERFTHEAYANYHMSYAHLNNSVGK